MTPARGKQFLALLLTGALCLLAQTSPSREGYRAAYKSWREADPGLERDATAGDALTPRAAKVADAAAAYAAARGAFLRDMADLQEENLRWLRAAEALPIPALSPAPDLIRFANREINTVSASAATFANNPDRAIQQLRQAFEREQAALEAVRSSVVERQQAEEKIARATLAVEQARGRALEEYPILTLALTQSTDLMRQEASAWAAYYPALADASKAPASPVSNAAPGSPLSDAPVASLSAAPAPAAARAPSITPLPLTRYTGVWAYQAGGQFHGSEPEFIDFGVHEDNGHATGTFYGRFRLPPGSTGDPVLRFDFSGDFKPTRNQKFTLETSDGAKGTIEIFPGGPFNVMEVTFTTDVKAGKVQQGDVILVKQ